jgi:hypothetical protein
MKTDTTEIPSCFTTSIQHLYYESCLDRLRQLVRMKTSTRLVIVTGPTGVGKTTLREQFEEYLKTLSAQERENDPEMVAYGSCSVKAPGPTAFSWKDTYLQMMRSLHHPFAESDFTSRSIRKFDDGHPVLKSISPEAAHRLSNDRLFRILQRTIDHRKPKALIFDEAHHLLRVASSQSLVNQLEHLKYIADETKTLHVLFGTYELIRLIDLSSALIRRREVVHFPRYIYAANDPLNSLEPFAKVVAVFAADLDPMCKFGLLTEVAYLYQGCVGCVGVLRDWLFRAYTAAKATDAGLITKEILEQTILAASDRLELIEVVEGGETYFKQRSKCEKRYLVKLGFLAPDPNDRETTENPKERAWKPFTRKPHNDPVGIEQLNLRNNAA